MGGFVGHAQCTMNNYNNLQRFRVQPRPTKRLNVQPFFLNSGKKQQKTAKKRSKIAKKRQKTAKNSLKKGVLHGIVSTFCPNLRKMEAKIVHFLPFFQGFLLILSKFSEIT